MSNILYRFSKRFFIYSTLSISFLTFSIPLPAIDIKSLAVISDTEFVGQIEDLINQMIALRGCASKQKMYSLAGKIRVKIQKRYGIKISLDDALKHVAAATQKKGVILTQAQIKAFKKDYIQSKKKQNAYRQYEIEYKDVAGYELNDNDFEQYYQNNYGVQPQEQPQRKVPPSLAYGISMALAGAFLLMVPIGVCRGVGLGMLTTGGTEIVKYIYDVQYEEDKK